MGTISVSLPSDGDTIDAADYNTPINTIVNLANGNIDNANIAAAAAIAGTKLADSAISTAKIASKAATLAKLDGGSTAGVLKTDASGDVTVGAKTTDANSWTIYDYGAWKIYKKRLTFSQTISTGAVLSISSTNLPTGLASLTGYFISYSYATTSNAYALSVSFESATSATALNFTTCSNDLVSRSYSGFVDVTIEQA